MGHHQKNILSLTRVLSACDAPRGTLGKLTSLYGINKAFSVLCKDPYGALQCAGASLDLADRAGVSVKLRPRERVLGHADWILAHRSMNQAMLAAKLRLALELPDAIVRRAIGDLLAEGALLEVEGQVVSRTFYQINKDVAVKVTRRIEAGSAPHPGLQRALAAAKGLSEEQMQAIAAAVRHKLSIITGGPGSGKSHVVREMINCVPGARVTAPTGRAARNCSGKTVHYFKTIQESGNNDFAGVELIIVDEASMLSTELFWAVLQMAPENAHIVLVGDVNQLPPIDSGDVLRDLLDVVPVTRLTTNVRSVSGIQQFAQGILEGRVCIPETGDVEIIPCESFEDVVNKIPEIGKRLLATFGVTDTTVLDRQMFLTPHNATRISLNKAMQLLMWGWMDEVTVRLLKDFPGAPRGTRAIASVSDAQVCVVNFESDRVEFRSSLAAAEKLVGLMPDSDSIETEGCVLFPGDKVIVTKNTPSACNGDIGLYRSVRRVELVDGCTVEIPAVSEADPGMTLAYAVTVHKAQGSEFDAVVIPVTSIAAWDMTLLYTAATRAKKKVYVMGSLEDLHAIVKCTRPPRVSILRALL